MKHKVSELEGALLDAAVAKAVGEDPTKVQPLRYSRSWRDAGPIIERERIELEFIDPADGTWYACVNPLASGHCVLPHYEGLTPLIAAMRAFVASKLGEEVEL